MEFPILLGSFPNHIVLDWLLNHLFLKDTLTRRGLEPHVSPIMPIPGSSRIWNWCTRAYWRMKVAGIRCKISLKKGVIWCGLQKGGSFWCGLPKKGVIQCAKMQF